MRIRCPFCRHDPFHYVDNGLGFEAVAVTCCDPGLDLFGLDQKQARLPRKILALRRSHSPRKKARAKRLLDQHYGW
ncbi:hypothetical protein [Burkholderia gladioli]|uniref:hypothetical protein n=1 Tax=Burkholderia gladioli TaxID=28095 RepID=UPI00164097E3|nr:hypothetical protein [Burkholderia gladioli]